MDRCGLKQGYSDEGMAPLRVPGVFDADDRHLGYGCAGLRDKLADAREEKFHVGLGDRGFDPGVPEQDDDALVRGAPHRGRITAPDAGRVFEEGIADGLSVAQQQAAFRGREVQYPA